MKDRTRAALLYGLDNIDYSAKSAEDFIAEYGFVLAPVEPTDIMLDGGVGADVSMFTYAEERLRVRYQAMLKVVETGE